MNSLEAKYAIILVSLSGLLAGCTPPNSTNETPTTVTSTTTTSTTTTTTSTTSTTATTTAETATKTEGPNALRGKDIFDRNCASCHLDGANMLQPDKPICGEAFQKKYASDEALAKRIREGVPGTGMPPFDDTKFSDKEMPDLIAYIRRLRPQ